MISLDPIKQIHSKPFNLIAADAGKNCRTGKLQIARDFTRIEGAHVKIRRIAFRIKGFAATRDAEGGSQPMGSSDSAASDDAASPKSVTLRGVRLQSGFALDQVEVAYQTLGTLSARRDNAILVCHALSGTAHVAGLHPRHRASRLVGFPRRAGQGD